MPEENITLTARGIASNHKSQVAEEEGIGMDVGWTTLFVQINMLWKMERRFSMNVNSPSSVKAFCSFGLSISHRHVDF